MAAAVGLAGVCAIAGFAYQTGKTIRTATSAVRTNDAAEDFASFNEWRMGVEQTLKAAEAKEQNERPPEPRQEEISSADLGVAADRDAPAKEAKEPDPFSASPVIDRQRAIPSYDAGVSSERVDTPQLRPSRHAWNRGRWRGRHFGWRYSRVTGVARGFPFVLSFR